jgi:hypothetical protein
MSGDRTLLREAAFKYVRAAERYERHQARGNADEADDALADMQTMERCLTISEHSSEWRQVRR